MGRARAPSAASVISAATPEQPAGPAGTADCTNACMDARPVALSTHRDDLGPELLPNQVAEVASLPLLQRCRQLCEGNEACGRARGMGDNGWHRVVRRAGRAPSPAALFLDPCPSSPLLALLHTTHVVVDPVRGGPRAPPRCARSFNASFTHAHAPVHPTPPAAPAHSPLMLPTATTTPPVL
jgi:hypothetical protein